MLGLILLAAAVLPADYRADANWLCRPDQSAACTADTARTVISADGTTRVEEIKATRAPQADCFYVYPTVSLDPTPNSDMVAGDEERTTAAAQLGPFAGICRLFAPMYRQVTLAGLHAIMAGKPSTADRDLPYADVRAAWHDYLTRDNHGRPFVLIGHSQGSIVLKRLIADEIDGKPVAARMLSAILPGTTVLVPVGKDVGGDFKALPLCRTDGQTGCILTWGSYRDTAPPPPTGLFGKSPDPAMAAGCTNPAKLPGGSAPLDAILGAPWFQGGVAQYRQPATWSAAGKPLTTRLVRVPGLMSGGCVAAGPFTYLAVHVSPTAAPGLADTVAGVAAVGDTAWPDWGFHVIDTGIVAGDLVRVIERQIAARRHR